MSLRDQWARPLQRLQAKRLYKRDLRARAALNSAR